MKRTFFVLPLALTLLAGTPLSPVQAADNPAQSPLQTVLERSGMTYGAMRAEGDDTLVIEDVVLPSDKGQSVAAKSVRLKGMRSAAFIMLGAGDYDGVVADGLELRGVTIRESEGEGMNIDRVVFDAVSMTSVGGQISGFASDRIELTDLVLLSSEEMPSTIKHVHLVGAGFEQVGGAWDLLLNTKGNKAARLSIEGMTISHNAPEDAATAEQQEMVQMLKILGYDDLTLSFELALEPRGSDRHTVAFTMAGKEMFEASGDLKLAGASDKPGIFRMPLGKGRASAKTGAFDFEALGLTYKDRSLVKRLLDYHGSMQGKTGEEYGKQLALTLPVMAIALGKDGMAKLAPVIKSAGAFLTDPGTLKLEIAAPEPIAMKSLFSADILKPDTLRNLTINASAMP